MNKIKGFFYSQNLLTLVFLSLIVYVSSRVFISSRFTTISELNNHSIDNQRDIYSTFDSEDQIDQGLPIDPFDLMNRLKQAEAMDDATTPSDALDEALNAFDQSAYENVPNE